jgi:hypothetical protein
MSKSVKFVQFVSKRITSVRFFVNKRTNSELPFARWANSNGLRKIARASVFRLKRQHIKIDIYVYIYLYIHIYIYIYIYIFTCMLPFQCIYAKQKFVFLGPQTINGTRHLLCQPTCRSMQLVILQYFNNTHSQKWEQCSVVADGWF